MAHRHQRQLHHKSPTPRSKKSKLTAALSDDTRPHILPTSQHHSEEKEKKRDGTAFGDWEDEILGILGVRPKIGDGGGYEYAIKVRRDGRMAPEIGCADSGFLAERCPLMLINFLEKHMILQQNDFIPQSHERHPCYHL